MFFFVFRKLSLWRSLERKLYLKNSAKISACCFFFCAPRYIFYFILKFLGQLLIVCARVCVLAVFWPGDISETERWTWIVDLSHLRVCVFFCITFALFALHDKIYRPLNGCRSMTSVIVSLCIDSRRFLFSVINKNSTRVTNVDKMETCFLV